MLAWLPTYFTETLHLEDLSHAAHTSVLPPLAGIFCSVLAGPVADRLIMASWPVPVVRKIMQVCLDGWRGSVSHPDSYFENDIYCRHV